MAKEQVNDAIAQDTSTNDAPVEFTPSMLSDIVDELKGALDHEPETKDREEKKIRHIYAHERRCHEKWPDQAQLQPADRHEKSFAHLRTATTGSPPRVWQTPVTVRKKTTVSWKRTQ